jgi:hypothetical protein
MRTSLYILNAFRCYFSVGLCIAPHDSPPPAGQRAQCMHDALDDGTVACACRQCGSRTQQTRKNPILSAVNPILSAVNLSVGDANNLVGTLGKVVPSPIVYSKCVKSTESSTQLLRNLNNFEATFDLMNIHEIPYMENYRIIELRRLGRFSMWISKYFSNLDAYVGGGPWTPPPKKNLWSGLIFTNSRNFIPRRSFSRSHRLNSFQATFSYLRTQRNVRQKCTGRNWQPRPGQSNLVQCDFFVSPCTRAIWGANGSYQIFSNGMELDLLVILIRE